MLGLLRGFHLTYTFFSCMYFLSFHDKTSSCFYYYCVLFNTLHITITQGIFYFLVLLLYVFLSSYLIQQTNKTKQKPPLMLLMRIFLPKQTKIASLSRRKWKSKRCQLDFYGNNRKNQLYNSRKLLFQFFFF